MAMCEKALGTFMARHVANNSNMLKEVELITDYRKL